MAAPANSNMKNVLDSATGDRHVSVRLHVSGNVATLYSKSTVVARRDDVTAVEHPTRKSRKVTFADGATWEGEIRSGCGCG